MQTLHTFSLASLPRRLLLASVTALTLMGSQTQAADKLPVTASFSILGDLVRVVGEMVGIAAIRRSTAALSSVISSLNRTSQITENTSP